MAKFNRRRRSGHQRLRNKVVGTPERPRLNVYRSLHHIHAQIIDDSVGHTPIADPQSLSYVLLNSTTIRKPQRGWSVDSATQKDKGITK